MRLTASPSTGTALAVLWVACHFQKLVNQNWDCVACEFWATFRLVPLLNRCNSSYGVEAATAYSRGSSFWRGGTCKEVLVEIRTLSTQSLATAPLSSPSPFLHYKEISRAEEDSPANSLPIPESSLWSGCKISRVSVIRKIINPSKHVYNYFPSSSSFSSWWSGKLLSGVILPRLP